MSFRFLPTEEDQESGGGGSGSAGDSVVGDGVSLMEGGDSVVEGGGSLMEGGDSVVGDGGSLMEGGDSVSGGGGSLMSGTLSKGGASVVGQEQRKSRWDQPKTKAVAPLPPGIPTHDPPTPPVIATCQDTLSIYCINKPCHHPYHPTLSPPLTHGCCISISRENKEN